MSGIAERLIKLRNSGPGWVAKAIDGAMGSERTPLRQLKAAFAGRFEVPTPPVPDRRATVRVLVGPYNYAGQGGRWSAALECPDRSVSARSFAVSAGGFGFQVDTAVPLPVFIGSSKWKSALASELRAYTHVLVESFGSFFGRGTGEVILSEVRDLERLGLRVALVCHGSDIRSPRRAIERDPTISAEAWGDALQRVQRAADEHQRVVEALGIPVFVSTPDLLADVPEARWLPVVVDPEPWAAAAALSTPVGHSRRLRVLHAPSNAGLKGSPSIDMTCRKLADAGLIEYVRVNGVPADEMPAVLAGVDVVIDQIVLGSYGVAACEGLAAGRLVLANVSEPVRRYIKDETGAEVPIVQVTAQTLESKLRELADDMSIVARLAIPGSAFVKKVHGAQSVRRVLQKFLEPLAEAQE